MKLTYLILPLLLVLALLSASAAFAQDRSVTVAQRDADIALNADGSVNVVETWVVNFSGGPFRFAFRSIPFNRISSIVFQGVSENGVEYNRAGSETSNTFTVEVGSGERTLTWYFPPTSNATRTFVLRYTLYDALRIYPDGDQFWYKFIEADRAYTIQSAQVVVHLPANAEPSEIAATTYRNNLDAGGGTVRDGQTVEFSGGPFPPDTEWEVRAAFPHGVVTQSVQPWQAADDARVAQEERAARAGERLAFFSTLATLLILLGGGLGVLLLWFLRGRDQPVLMPAEFIATPPDDLTPALAGTLLDEEANVRDVLATLVDWAQRGIIRIRATPQEGASADPNKAFVYERIGTDAPPLQHAYERELMKRLWQGETSRSIGYIRWEFNRALDDMFSLIYDELVADGYFPTRPDRVRSRFSRYGWLLLLMICPAAFFFQLLIGQAVSSDAPFSLAALAPWVALFGVGVLLMFVSRYLPRKTAQGAEAAARWNAFKRYLEHIEKYTKVADAKDQFEKYLPFAVAFGLDKTWVEKFAAVDTPAPTWFSTPALGRVAGGSTWRTTPGESSPRPFGGGTLGGVLGENVSGGEARAAPGLPTLDSAASGAFNSLNSISSSFFSMLNTTGTSFVSSNPSSSPSSRSFRSSGGHSSWGGSRGFSGGFRGGRGGGGGRSGFG